MRCKGGCGRASDMASSVRFEDSGYCEYCARRKRARALRARADAAEAEVARLTRELEAAEGDAERLAALLNRASSDCAKRPRTPKGYDLTCHACEDQRCPIRAALAAHAARLEADKEKAE